VLESDNILVVARQGRTTKEQATAVRETLDGLLEPDDPRRERLAAAQRRVSGP
jgi:hypothetical protein